MPWEEKQNWLGERKSRGVPSPPRVTLAWAGGGGEVGELEQQMSFFPPMPHLLINARQIGGRVSAGLWVPPKEERGSLGPSPHSNGDVLLKAGILF